MNLNEPFSTGPTEPAASSRPSATKNPSSIQKAGSTSILVAALSGLSMALGWENHREESTIAVEAKNDQDWLDLDVGPLEKLNITDEPS